jgi:octaprenyl-diphosphate synthase
MDYLSKIRQPINEELSQFESHFKKTMNTNVPLLDIILKYMIRRKGKQIRPMFVFLTAKLLGEIKNSAYTAASLIELLHTATLIHDDVVDDSYKRRGYFSLNALWKSKITVLVGDYLLSRGLLLAVDNKEYDLLEIVSNAVREMSEGELLQVKKSRKIYIDETEYFDIIRKKTASLISSCASCGAKAAGADRDTIQLFHNFGEKVGLAFQIKDDLLDYQNARRIGKPTGNDIREKKVTLPLIYALQNADEKSRKAIKKAFGKKSKTKGEVQHIVDFAKTHNGIKAAEDKMYALKNEALEMLKPFENNDAKSGLTELVNFTVERNK